MNIGSEAPLVLVVDDEWLVRAATVEFVEAAGFRAIGVRNADDAIALLEARTDVRVVITDIEMPGSMDGLELVEVIRTRWPPVRLIIVSGLHDLRERAISQDVRLFGKPFSHAEMTNHLQSLADVAEPSTLRRRFQTWTSRSPTSKSGRKALVAWQKVEFCQTRMGSGPGSAVHCALEGLQTASFLPCIWPLPSARWRALSCCRGRRSDVTDGALTR